MYSTSTSIIDSDHPAIIAYAEGVVEDEIDPTQKAIRLYYAVRDSFRYEPYCLHWTPEGVKASATLDKGYGYCVTKAVLLAALGRAVGFQTRLGFADVKNHLNSEKLKRVMETDVFFWHGYVEIFLNDRWVKATPAFNRSLCERVGIKPLEFDGLEDSVFHEFDRQGEKHMEYVKDHGQFEDLPFEVIDSAIQECYPALYKMMKEGGRMGDDFEREAFAGD